MKQMRGFRKREPKNKYKKHFFKLISKSSVKDWFQISYCYYFASLTQKTPIQSPCIPPKFLHNRNLSSVPSPGKVAIS